MKTSTKEEAKSIESHRDDFFNVVLNPTHSRVNPCFMTGKGCVYTDPINETLAESGRQQRADGFHIAPFRPGIRTFTDNCLKPFLREVYTDLGGAGRTIRLEQADEVTRTGIIICEGICKRIQQSSFVVADISLPNANVFYELGLAYGIDHNIVAVYEHRLDFPKQLLSPAGALGKSGLRAKAYTGLDLIKWDDFDLRDLIWRRSDSTDKWNTRADNTDFIYLELIDQPSDDFREAVAADEDRVEQDDLPLSLRDHVKSAVGLAMADFLRPEGPSRALPESSRDIIEKHLRVVNVLEADDFTVVRDRIDASYCSIIRTGPSCNPMAYFWLGYAHATGKNVIPVTQVTFDKQAGDDREEVKDLAFDIRAQRHMVFNAKRPDRLRRNFSDTLREMISADFREWSRKRFWGEILAGTRGEVSILTGALHSDEHNREVVGDWDLRAASELATYFAKHQFAPRIETPVYQIETTKLPVISYVQKLKQELDLGNKNCVIIASPDVNPLSEIILGKLYGVSTEELFSDKDASWREMSVVKVRKQSGAKDEGQDGRTSKRVFYREVAGLNEQELRGFASKSMDPGGYEPRTLDGGVNTNLLPYHSQALNNQESFSIYAHLVIAPNPFSDESQPPKFVVLLNGVSGPATFALTHVLTGGVSEEFVDYSGGVLREGRLGQPSSPELGADAERGVEPGTRARPPFNPETSSENILNEILSEWKPYQRKKGIECVIKVDIAGGEAGEVATFDWRRIVGWKLENAVLGNKVREIKLEKGA